MVEQIKEKGIKKEKLLLEDLSSGLFHSFIENKRPARAQTKFPKVLISTPINITELYSRATV